LEYIDYNKRKVKEFLIKELGWRDYGGKHYESVFTKFFQSYFLPTRFGYDKRKAHLSSLIVSGQLTREEAIEELSKPLYDPSELENDRLYFTKKLGISHNEFESIMNQPIVDYSSFKNQIGLEKKFRKAVKIISYVKRKLV
jgi:hypothetical protein